MEELPDDALKQPQRQEDHDGRERGGGLVTRFMVILTWGSIERHYYVDGDSAHDARLQTESEWREEFPDKKPHFVTAATRGAATSRQPTCLRLERRH